MKKIRLFLVALVCIIAVNVSNAQNTPFPKNISVKDLKGKSVSTSTFTNNGKPVVVSFWATWCKPCIRELNAINELYEDWVDETGVKVIAVSIDDAQSKGRIPAIVTRFGWEFEIYNDANRDLFNALGGTNPPLTVLIDGKGKIVYKHASYNPGDEEELQEKIEKIAK